MKNLVMLLVAVLGTSVMATAAPIQTKPAPVKEVKATKEPKAKADKKAKTETKVATKAEPVKAKK
ncbi:hypothetical protein OIU83_19370 [Flavobacterium sp. LS1R49]|uniref:Acid-shock protein n=1 Tax=Flavobacterium shii TaxID=2987687 RepID=A0A9X2ZEV7_9FLAO|nr:hypothetical protein [Flavobacterium shii]MCV9929829.1 hypothetical protein [Flavobacterium shii]